jgi:4-hydroxybenzoate polyprenyltransferase
MPWLQLIRWKNLLIIFLTQWLAWWCVVTPVEPTVLSPFHFLLIGLSTVLIAAAGYIINDYFDIQTDTINKPEKMVLVTAIPRKQAISAHAALNVLALLLAGFVAAKAHSYMGLLLQVGSIALLWFYSTHFKRQYVSGNIVISVLTALTILILVVYEPALHAGGALRLHFPCHGVWVLCFYAYFAFMLTWMREVVKDMEDHIGDEASGCVTMPIRRGLQFAARFTVALAVVVILSLAIGVAALASRHYVLLPYYCSALLILPLILWSVYFYRGRGKAHYHKASGMLKLIMLLGVCSLIIYHFEF